jgi:RNA polymerase sigma factor (sigma-70 family)
MARQTKPRRLISPEERDSLALALVGRSAALRAQFLATGMTEVEAEESVLDLISDVILYRIDSFDPAKGRFEAWIYRVAENAAKDYWRARQNHPDEHPQMEELSNVELIGNRTKGLGPKRGLAGEPAATRSRTDPVKLARATRALNELRAADRDILLAVDPDSDESWRDIGSRLNISADVAKERYSRAKQRFCRRYEMLGALGVTESSQKVIENA